MKAVPQIIRNRWHLHNAQNSKFRTSLMSSNRVSGINIRILKISDQRLARKIGPTLPKIKKNARQRLATIVRGAKVAAVMGNVRELR
jgi:hypothetical protein